MNNLVVIIPTKNESNNLFKILQILHSNLLDTKFEIFISNNSSQQLSQELQKYKFTELTPLHFLNTAEENMFWASSQVKAEYIWFLGDDDIPSDSGTREVAHLVNLGEYDCMVFNGIRKSSREKQKLISNVNDSYSNIIEFYKANGMLNGPASISLYVFKHEFLRKQILNKIIMNSPIYSHVFFMIKSFHQSRFKYFPLLLTVHYRSDKYSSRRYSPNWITFAKRTNNFYLFPWTLGLLRGIDSLIKDKIVSKDFLHGVNETGPSGVGYRLLPKIENDIRQIFIDTHPEIRQITRKEIDEIAEYTERIDGFSDEIKELLKSDNPNNYLNWQNRDQLLETNYFRKWRNRDQLLETNYFRKWQKNAEFRRRLFYLGLKDYYWIVMTFLWKYIPVFFKPGLKIIFRRK